MNAHIEDMVGRVVSGDLSAEELINDSLHKIKQFEEYHAILDVNSQAIPRARSLDKEIKKGRKGRLLGVPFIAKDNFLTFGTETTAASNILKGFRAPYQATAIEKLETEGAILVAKSNLDAFAHGSSTENSDFGPTKNPHDKTRVPGGSSGGSAAAVALDIVPFALGTDTGGSIRLPASFCGVVGYKPTYGLVSRYGVIAMASSTDVIGLLARSVADAALVLDVMAGKDKKDSTTIQRPQQSLAAFKNKSLHGLRVGVIKEFMDAGVDPGVRASAIETIEGMKQAGAKISEISLPLQELALACYYVIVPAEISSNLSRYDGIKFGYSASEAATLEEAYSKSRSRGFGAEAKRRIMIGNYVLSSGYYDAYYKKAMQVRSLIIKEFADAFKNLDILVSPVAPTTAFKLGENTTDPLKMYLADIMTVGASLAGLPAVSVPIRPSQDLPVGLQIVGPQQNDRSVLSTAASVEALMESAYA